MAAGAHHMLSHPDGEEDRLLLETGSWRRGGDSPPLVSRRAGKCQQVVRLLVAPGEMRQGSAANIKEATRRFGSCPVVSALIPTLGPAPDPV